MVTPTWHSERLVWYCCTILAEIEVLIGIRLGMMSAMVKVTISIKPLSLLARNGCRSTYSTLSGLFENDDGFLDASINKGKEATERQDDKYAFHIHKSQLFGSSFLFFLTCSATFLFVLEIQWNYSNAKNWFKSLETSFLLPPFQSNPYEFSEIIWKKKKN